METEEFSLYSIMGSIGLGPWIKTLEPQTTTTNPNEAWYTEDEEEADANCPSGFSVGPRPPRPH